MAINRKIIIVNNEKISVSDNKFFCDNIDIKSIPEGLEKYFDVTIVGRKSDDKKSHEIKVEKIKIATNIFTFLNSIIKTFKSI